jgi:hypothetical protein
MRNKSTMRNQAARFISVALITTLCFALVGCDTWERTTFQSLSASKALIDGADSDYRAGRLPQTDDVYFAIVKAKNVQTVAVHSFDMYWSIKKELLGAVTSEQEKTIQARLNLAREGVVHALSDLAAATAEIKSWKASSTNPKT